MGRRKGKSTRSRSGAGCSTQASLISLISTDLPCRGHHGTLWDTVRTQATWADLGLLQRKMVLRRRYLGPAPGLQLLSGVHPNPDPH